MIRLAICTKKVQAISFLQLLALTENDFSICVFTVVFS